MNAEINEIARKAQRMAEAVNAVTKGIACAIAKRVYSEEDLR